MEEEQFEAVRRWGEGLQQDAREEVSAAGKAIVLLCAEIDRLERELWSIKTATAADSSSEEGEPDLAAADEDEPPAVEATLRERLKNAMGGLYSRPAKR
jgi:hypothetical protein